MKSDAIVQYLKSRGVKVIEAEDIDTKLDVWRQWYKGKVDKFHNYKVYSGKRKLTLNRASLNMASRVCQRWADLLLNEKCEINCTDENTQEVVNQLLDSTNFYVKGNNLIEQAFALGGGFLIEYFDGKQTSIKYITQDFMYPISYDSGRLKEVAFASKKVIDTEEYTYLETHMLDDNGNYVIDNVLLSGKDGQLKEVNEAFYEEHGIMPKWETGSDRPLFQMIKPNVANRDDFNSPYGTSVFSGAVDILKSIDIVYDSATKEFLLGKKRIFVRDGVTQFNVDGDGNQIRVFDPNDEVFYSLPDAEDPNSPPLFESNLALRVAEHDAEMQTQLNLLSQSVGFGSNGFKWEQGNAATATQIVSQNSEMFRTMKKHEMLLKKSIIDCVRGLLFVETTYNGTPVNVDDEITVNFDDSIIEDVSEQKRQALIEYNAGLIDAIEYYVQVYKLTPEQAIAYRDEMLARAIQPAEEAEPEI